MESNGFEQKPLILPAKKLNIIAFLLIVPLLAVTIFLFLLRWNALLEKHPEIIAITPMFFICFLASIFIHELIHGLTWSCFCPDRFHSIHFGFQLKTLTPYCHCAQPLKKFPYLLGTLMPCLILGVGTYLLSLLIPNFSLALFGAMNIAAAIGGSCYFLSPYPTKGCFGCRSSNRARLDCIFQSIKKSPDFLSGDFFIIFVLPASTIPDISGSFFLPSSTEFW